MTADDYEPQPVAWMHRIVEPGQVDKVLLSLDTSNPWSHWLQDHLDECQYTCTPLYAKREGVEDDN